MVPQWDLKMLKRLFGSVIITICLLSPASANDRGMYCAGVIQKHLDLVSGCFTKLCSHPYVRDVFSYGEKNMDVNYVLIEWSKGMREYTKKT